MKTTLLPKLTLCWFPINRLLCPTPLLQNFLREEELQLAPVGLHASSASYLTGPLSSDSEPVP